METGHEPQLTLSEEATKISYANATFVFQREYEIIVEFAQVSADLKTGIVVYRVAMNPKAAKGLLANLEEAMRLFEKEYGEVR